MKSKSKNKEYIKLAIVLGGLFFILGGFLLYLSIPLLSTNAVVLATQPVDPFDLIRGQYIIIRYEIASVPLIEGAEIGDAIYVILAEDINGISRYKSASLVKPSKDDLFIRGQISYIYEENMRVEYGIEQYFFERGAKFETRGMDVKVKLSGNGGARIVELLQDGERVEMTYRDKTFSS